MQNVPKMLMRSKHLTYFQQHGEVFAYHDRFGYLIGMSRDLVDLLEFHAVTLRMREEVDERFEGCFEKEQLDEFLQVFQLFSCLHDSEMAEERQTWDMVPVRSRWVVYHQPAPDELTFWRTDRSGTSHSEEQKPWAARLWAAIDNETKLSDLVQALSGDLSLSEEPDPQRAVLDVLARWVHHDRQYLKLAKAPVSKFGPEHQWPSYLRSQMPYAPWRPGVDPEPVNPLDSLAEPIAPPHAYYAEHVEDAESQFRNVETTLSHLLRHPNPLLAGGTYADRVVAVLIERGFLGAQTRRIVEVGGGMGTLAAGVLARLRADHPVIYDALSYTIVDLSPALQGKQRETARAADVADKITWIAANAETHDFGESTIDLLLCNEVIGDFTSVKLTTALLGLDCGDPVEEVVADWSEELIDRLGESGRLIRAHALPLRDAPEEFYLNTGALRFVEHAARALTPGGAAFVTEYGDAMQFPTASTHLDHIEFSIHFGHLQRLAAGLGLDARVEYLQTLIGLDRDAHTLETTRTYYSSLRAMLSTFDLDLDKRAWTQEAFTDLVGPHLPHIGDIRFRIVDERCMGLAPHEFKALLLKKPT